MKMWHFFRNYNEFQNGNSKAVDQCEALLNKEPCATAHATHPQSWFIYLETIDRDP